MNWIDIEKEDMPLETDIIVSHKYGVEAIHFFNAHWKFWYSKEPVKIELLKSITHWCKPDKA